VHESYVERATRVTVVVESHIGVTTEFHGGDEPDLERLVDRCVADAVHHPVRSPLRRPDTVPTSLVSQVPRDTELRTMSWLDTGGTEHNQVGYTIEDSNGAKVDTHFERTWQELSFEGHVLARVPPHAPSTGDGQPEWSPERLLFPPWVLSQILLGPFAEGILGTAPLRKWPAETLLDPGWGEGVDYEGTARGLVVFAEGRSLRNTPVDRLRAWTSGREPTGHAGLTGPAVRDLVVLPEAPTTDPLPLPPGSLVVEATCLARSPNGGSAVLALRLLNEDGVVQPPVVVETDDVADLLDAGHWRGPWQRGKGPWTSQWLVIGVPSRWLRIYPT
jgi:hypothetical protein